MRLSFWQARRTSHATRQPSFFRPSVEAMEDRLVLSAAALAPPALGPALFAPAAAHGASVLPLKITGVSFQNGQLMANAVLGLNSFTIPITPSATPNAADPTCPILHLQLAPIHLSLLGLNVDTSAICLSITAESGHGKLLGNLLCNVANLLNGGTPLGDILAGLTLQQAQTLETGLTQLLQGALRDVTSRAATPSILTGNVLHLSLGPVDLKLLGLDVHLDNCNNGPVTVDVTAVPGPGNLLGNLLSNLAGLLNQNPNHGQLNRLLGEITHAIHDLLNTL